VPEVRLVLRAQRGDTAAAEEVCQRHAGCIRRTAGRYRHRVPGVELADLVGIGTWALLRAIMGYEPEAGSFTRYASSCVRNALEDARRTARVVHSLEEPDALCGGLSPEEELLGRVGVDELLDRLRGVCGGHVVEAWLMAERGESTSAVRAATGVGPLQAATAVRRALEELGERR